MSNKKCISISILTFFNQKFGRNYPNNMISNETTERLTSIVFVWSQFYGGNIDKEQLAEVPSKT